LDSGDLILVTGASGFVGSAIANAARTAGYRVRVLVRERSPRINVSALDELAVGDLRDRSSLVPALRDVRYLIHAAADYRLWARVPGEIMRTNLEGTEHIMEEALRAGVERIVHTSSVAAIALKDGSPADESARLSETDAIGAYKKSKVAAERLVESMVAQQGLPAVIVNPSTPIGPRDVKPTPTGRIIIEAGSGRMPGFVDTGLNLAHVDDIAAGHLAALRHGRIGDRYILGGENVYLRDMLAEIARLAGRRPPAIRFPIAPLFPLALGAEWVARLTGREPFATVDGLRMARHRMFFNDAKARRELGYSSRPWQDAIADAVAWFRKAGYLR
jgi:dihydroflavonol-4-reductase